ncbi:MAG: hypothetical protein UT55_C0069G0006 [Candidatus Peregrinibacteria bacterium GW2011_GWE2_39_6]|nr:MAG: hypothetical protein UT36_C0008G0059 [Candidatus Peregrinibacteria bacterium GW2011_GWF2_39_17]KKR24190.1 MAG: hypothetical protein UT55_C0069G0006 [Candidatus Peregrinibacteria bacterium GW2011_GWE2_39_6]
MSLIEIILISSVVFLAIRYIFLYLKKPFNNCENLCEGCPDANNCNQPIPSRKLSGKKMLNKKIKNSSSQSWLQWEDREKKKK